MPYIPLKENLPGITGLLDYRQDTALPIRQLTQILLRGESTLTEGERELIATVVSAGNECRFCTAAHTAAANCFLDDPAIAESAKTNIATSSLSEKMKALLTIAALFSLYNRYVDGLASVTPTDPAFYDRLGHILQEKGYLPSPDRYAAL
ncbi:MAG TPA: carboxymuconolactone decarboxylase family protein [Puia sp.]|nr:carboxymuconolactone decarboxylase family protein [Puia sp.]